ncbi:MAG: metal ABC transporter permease [Chlamydiia bacterium]|nr:metal ABC transporter permease [Chlamydiia bacterium]
MSLSPLFQDPFLQLTLWAALLASIASGTIGSFVVIKRIAFIAGSIAHSLLGGVGLCLWLQRIYHLEWLLPLYGAFLGAIGSAILLGWVHLHYRQREDAVIAAIWSTGTAAGVVFLSMTPGTNTELLNYLFGNILWIHPNDLLFLAFLDLLILGFVCFYYRRFLALCFDEEQAKLRGIPVQRLYMLLLSLTAVTVVLLVQIIGTVLVIALLTIPSTLAGLFTHRLHVLIASAIGLSMLFSFFGLCLSYQLDWPPGSTIALVTAAAYFIALPLKTHKPRFFRNYRPSRVSIIIDSEKHK